jgi:O-antigen/teichoic acid export membrane protein
MMFAFAISAKNLLPELGFGFSFNRDTTKLVLSYSSGVVGYQVLANLLLLFERGWITRKLGPESLTYYVVPMSLAMFVHSFISSLMLVIFPLASELQSNKEKLLRLYLKATKIVCLFVFFLVTTLIVGSRPFLTIYLGEEFAEKSATLLILHSITFGALAILTVSWQMTEGLGFPNYNFKLFTICLILSLTLMFLLTDSYGNLGVAVARLAGFCTIFFSIFYVENWFFNKVQTDFWVKLIGTLAIASLLAGAVQYFLLRNFSTNWFSFIISISSGAIVYVFSLWLFRFVTAEEKNLIKGILRR